MATVGITRSAGVPGLAATLAALLCVVVWVPQGRAAEAKDSGRALEWHKAATARYAREDFTTAGESWDKAFALDGLVQYVWNAARAHHRASNLELARDRYQHFLARPDAPAKLRAQAVGYLQAVERRLEAWHAAEVDAEKQRRGAVLAQLAELERRINRVADEPSRPAQPDPSFMLEPSIGSSFEAAGPDLAPWGWASLGTGLALGITGAVLFVHRSSLLDDLSVSVDNQGLIRGLTQARADELARQADAVGTAGVVTTALGGALLVTGVVLLFVDGADAPALGAAPVPGGTVVTAGGRF